VEVCDAKILVVDNDANIRKILKTRLENLGYTIFLANNGMEALKIFDRVAPDVVLLDIILPKRDGYEVCYEIRKVSKIPIIMLTVLSNLSNRVLGFELGVDDYLLKPFSPKELEFRIQAILRRSYQGSTVTKKKPIYQIGSLSFDFDKRSVFRGTTPIKLTSTEFRLVEFLIMSAGKPLSRVSILNNIWGYTPERDVDTRVVDVHIARLRAKIEEDSSAPDLILTARGKGYMFSKYR